MEGVRYFINITTLGHYLPYLAIEIRMLIWELASSRYWQYCNMCGHIAIPLHLQPNNYFILCSRNCGLSTDKKVEK